MQCESWTEEPTGDLVPCGIGLVTEVGEPRGAVVKHNDGDLVPCGIGLVTEVGEPTPIGMGTITPKQTSKATSRRGVGDTSYDQTIIHDT